jgi:hypothetical protein
MSYALARGTRWEPKQHVCARDVWTRTRARLAREWELTTGRVAPGPQLDGITATWLWLRGAIAVEKAHGGDGTLIRRSVPQIIRGVANDLDWELTGVARADLDRYGSQVKNRLRYLEILGYAAGWEPVESPAGEGLGILVHVPAGVAQSVQPARLYRRSRRPGAPPPSARQLARRGLARLGRAHRSGDFPQPSGPSSGAVDLPPLTVLPGDERACMREAPTASVDAIERACTPSLRPALRRLRTALVGAERPRRVLLEAARDGVPAVVVALAAWEVATNGQAPRLSLEWRSQLERSAEQLDRLLGPGRGAAALAARIGEIADDEWTEDRRVASLAYYAHWLKQTARAQLRRARGAGKPRAWKSRRPEASSW